MSNSPFEIFRRNLKPLMVLLTGLALFAFVVLPVLDTYMRRSAGTGGEEIVARFDGTKLSRSRVDYFTRNHQSTVRFLVELAQETIARGGAPKTAGFQFDSQNNQVRSLGINEQPSIEGTIRTFMFASRAGKAGFELDDSTLEVWLERFTDGMISNSDVDAMLMQSTQNQMGRPHLYEQLRNHLLANVYLQRGYTGLFMGDGPMSGPLMTPQEQWSNFLKLNRNAVVSTYGVLVNDYLDKTNKNPSESDVVAMYDEGKARDSNDQSADPAFHRRYSAKFEYVVGDIQKFLDEEIAKLSQDDIRAEYQRRLKGGEFKLPDNSLSEVLDDSADGAAETEQPKTDSDKSTEDSEASSEEMKDDAKEDSKQVTETGEASDAKEKSQPEDAQDKPAPDSEAKPPAEKTESTETDSEGEPAGDQSSVIHTEAVRLVALQDDSDKDDSDKADQEQPKAASGDEDDAKKPEASEQESTEKKDSKQKDGETKETEKQDGETKDDSPADKPDADKPDADKPDADKPDADKPSSDKPAGDGAEKDATKADEPKVESFEDVRQEIAEEMAGPAARQRLSTAVSEVANKMRRYFSESAIYESQISIGQKVDPPVRPDLAAIAEKSGLQHEAIGPYTEATITDEPIANSTEAAADFRGRGPSFSMMMFGFNNGRNELLPQQLFAPIRTMDGPAGKEYVAWKIEETAAYTPTLEEVRDEVVMAIRTKEARELAREAAEAIAKQASAADDSSIKDLAPEGKQDNVHEGLGPFTWMNSFGFAGATIGNVPELDSVGEEFMQTVFNSKVGEYGVATNQPGRVIYVIEPTKFEPALDELRRQFKQPTNRMMAMMLGNDAGPIIQDFYKSVDEQADYTNYLEGDQSSQ